MAKPKRTTIIAKKMIDIYLAMDEDKITEEQKTVKKDLEARETNTGEGHNPRLEYMTKRIDNIVKSFKKNEDSINKNSKMPKPSFDILNYEDEEIINFLMIFIEESINNRKTKSILNDKIDIDNEYTTIIDAIDNIYDKQNKSFEKTANKDYYINTFFFNNEIFDPHGIRIASPDFFKHDDEYNKDSILNKLLKDYDINTMHSIPKHISSAAIYNNYLVRSFDGENLFENFVGYNPLNSIVKYRILWEFFLKIIYINFQNLCCDGKIKKEHLDYIINVLNNLIKYIENKTEIKHETNLFNEFFKYNYLLKTRASTDMELICLNRIHEKGYIFINKEDLFFDDTGKPKEKYTNMETIEQKELNKLFNSGTKTVKNETFKKRMSFCKDFIPKYNELAGRNLDLNDTKTMRAVYRTIYVNKINDNNKNLYTISDQINTLYNKLDPDNPDHIIIPETGDFNLEKSKKEAHSINSFIFQNNYLLGSSISNELMLEYPDGYTKLTYKYEFMHLFNKLALLLLYNNCPYLDAPDGRNNKSTLALIKIKTCFESIMEALYKKI